MPKFGSVFRYILNINTIWGLMILISFGAAIFQHYTPKTSWIPANQFVAGENKIKIVLKDKDKAEHIAEYRLLYSAGMLTMPEKLPERGKDSQDPYLIGTSAKLESVGITWNAPIYGDYEILLNEGKAGRGKLVKLGRITDAGFKFANAAFELGIGLVGTFVLFLGLMKVGEDAGVVQMFAKILLPVIRFLFPGIPKDHPANGAIVMNMTTSILGLGNAATPFGLKAIEELQKVNPRKDTASDAMCMLVGYNTAGFALLPTTIIAVRKSAGSTDPYGIIGPCLIAGMASTITAIIMVKLLSALPMFSVSYTGEEIAAVQDELARTEEKKEA